MSADISGPSDAARPLAGALGRRAALARLGTVAAGAGAGAIAALATSGTANAVSTTAGAQTAFNVRDYGAVGDGTTDDTAAIQAAINAANAGGGGIVFLPPGTYLSRGQTLYSRIHLRGSGGDATILKLAAGANTAIVQSDGFAQLTGTGSAGGIDRFSIRDLTLDGNKAENPTGGYGIRVYGFEYEITEVIIFNCHNDGFSSEWGASAALPGPSHQMEARLSGLRSHDNDGHGVNFAGPHDSMFINCLAFQNRGTGFRLSGNAPGALMVNCHGWGIVQDLSFDLAAWGVNCLNCFADFNGGVGVRISGNDVQWIGGLVLGANQAGEIGVQFAPGRSGPAGCVVDTKIMNCGKAAIDLTAEKAVSVIRAVLWQPGMHDANGNPIAGTGLGCIGTPAPTTIVEITQGIGANDRNVVIRPAFDLRAQAQPTNPTADSVRIFARDSGGKTQLCALFPDGALRVLASN
jgi:Pectate lyase superfamily protein